MQHESSRRSGSGCRLADRLDGSIGRRFGRGSRERGGLGRRSCWWHGHDGRFHPGLGQALGLDPFGLVRLRMIEMRRYRPTGRRRFRPGSGRSAHIAVDQPAHPESHGEGDEPAGRVEAEAVDECLVPLGSGRELPSWHLPVPHLDVGRAAAQVSPPSRDSAWQTKPMPRERHRATTRRSAVSNRVGWIRPYGLPGTWIGPHRRQVLPSSAERSTQPAQARWLSTDVPARMVPFASWIGLARTGPKNPAGSISGFDHVFPESADVRT